MGLSISKIAAFLKPKRRWFQFSLATLFLLTTALAVWLSIWTNRARKQQRAVEAIREHGGSVAYSYETKKGPGPPTPPGPQWVRDSLGIDYLDDVVVANLTGDTFTDADLELLQGLPRLEYLFLQSANITDAGLANLDAFPRLDRLIVDSNNITDVGLAHLEGLHHLQHLTLFSDKITDAGLVHLQELRELKSLSLGGSITDAGMEHLMPLTQLRELRACGSPDDKADRIVFDALDNHTQMDFVDVPLPDVCEYLQDFHRIELQIDDAALKEAKIDKLIPVTFKTKGVPLSAALHSLLRPHGLDWYVGKDALVITTRDVVAKKHAGIERLQKALPNLKEVGIDW